MSQTARHFAIMEPKRSKSAVQMMLGNEMHTYNPYPPRRCVSERQGRADEYLPRKAGAQAAPLSVVTPQPTTGSGAAVRSQKSCCCLS